MGLRFKIVQQYSSIAERKGKTSETGGFELTLLAPRIERSTAEPKENVVIICRLREADFQKSSLAEFVGDARSFTWGSRGLLCGWAVARSRCLRGSAGARERPVLKTYGIL